MKRLLFLVFVVFCHPIFINCGNENRIINGEETPLGKFMFLPKIYLSYSSIGPDGAPHTKSNLSCSSTIISKRHILTAAHCALFLTNPYNRSIYETSWGYPFFVDVRPIEHDILKESDNIDITKLGIVSKVYVHFGYSEYFENDIAIIEFPKSVDFNITPVTLAKDYVDNYDDVGIVAGYGLYQFNVTSQSVSPDISNIPPTLRHVNVKIRPFIDFLGKDFPGLKAKDPQTKAYYDNLNKTLICAGNSGELPQRADHGDSGGPLLYEKNGKIYQLGIYSVLHDSNVKAPGCYTRVSSFCDWIESITYNEAKCEKMYENGPVTQPVTNINNE